MKPVSEHEIRLFRLHRRRLDARLDTVDVLEAAGACGLQNSPPGAWETALFMYGIIRCLHKYGFYMLDFPSQVATMSCEAF